MAYKIGQNIVNQKHRFVGLENGPVNSENVGHIFDYLFPFHKNIPFISHQTLGVWGKP